MLCFSKKINKDGESKYIVVDKALMAVGTFPYFEGGALNFAE